MRGLKKRRESECLEYDSEETKMPESRDRVCSTAAKEIEFLTLFMGGDLDHNQVVRTTSALDRQDGVDSEAGSIGKAYLDSTGREGEPRGCCWGCGPDTWLTEQPVLGGKDYLRDLVETMKRHKPLLEGTRGHELKSF